MQRTGLASHTEAEWSAVMMLAVTKIAFETCRSREVRQRGEGERESTNTLPN
jgi:hypothetical protein